MLRLSAGILPTRLLLVAALLIFSPLVEGGTTHLAVMVIRLGVLLLLGVQLLHALNTGALPRSLLGLGPAVALYLALAFVSTVQSPYTNQSVQWLLVLLTYGGLLYVLVCWLERWEHLAQLSAVLVGLGVLEAGCAMVQWQRGMSRATGTFFNPNFLGIYLGTLVTLALGLLSYWRPRRIGTLTALTVLVLGLLVAGMLVTGSRGAILATLLGIMIVLGIRFGRRAVAVFLVVVLIVLAVPNPIRDRVKAEHVANPFAYARLQIWEGAVRLIRDHPGGVGLGLYQYVYPRYSVPIEGPVARYGKTAQTAHNEYLQMAVELGLVSVVVFGGGIAVLMHRARASLRGRLRRRDRGLLVGATAAVAVILVHAAVDSPFHEPAVAILLTVLAAFILAAYRMSGGGRLAVYELRTAGRQRVAAGVGAFVLAGLAATVLRLGLAWLVFEAGEEALARQNSEAGVAYYQQAIALDPGKALYHSALAARHYHIWQQTGRAQSLRLAVEEVAEAAALNPLDGRLKGLLGKTYHSASRVPGQEPGVIQASLRKAREAYEAAVELEPHDPFHYLNLAQVVSGLGETDRAEALARQALVIEPNFLPARLWLLERYLRTGRQADARSEYGEIRERQERYRDVPKDPVEELYLNVTLGPWEALRSEVGR